MCPCVARNFGSHPRDAGRYPLLLLSLDSFSLHHILIRRRRRSPPATLARAARRLALSGDLLLLSPMRLALRGPASPCPRPHRWFASVPASSLTLTVPPAAGEVGVLAMDGVAAMEAHAPELEKSRRRPPTASCCPGPRPRAREGRRRARALHLLSSVSHLPPSGEALSELDQLPWHGGTAANYLGAVPWGPASMSSRLCHHRHPRPRRRSTAMARRRRRCCHGMTALLSWWWCVAAVLRMCCCRCGGAMLPWPGGDNGAAWPRGGEAEVVLLATRGDTSGGGT